jgi:ribosomal protein L11 methylase PrmA
MGERERIALFNMIQDRIPGNYVLDLFCGGGTLGIEAISRGARFAMFLDDSPVAVATANNNLKELGIYGMDGLSNFDPSVGGTGSAMKANVPIVVCTVRNTRQIFKNLAKLKKTDVPLHLVDVIPVEQIQGKTTGEISDMVYEKMIADLGEEVRFSES